MVTISAPAAVLDEEPAAPQTATPASPLLTIATPNPSQSPRSTMSTRDFEFIDLDDTERDDLHKTLTRAATQEPPEAKGAEFHGPKDDMQDEALREPDALLRQQAIQATRLNVMPSVWWEISRRSPAERQAFLDAEAAPTTSGGAASSGA